LMIHSVYPPAFLPSWYDGHRDLHSFPPRRSSDLTVSVSGSGISAGGLSTTHTSRMSVSRHRTPQSFSQPTREKLCGVLCQLTDIDRKSTRLNSSHVKISYAVFCLKNKNEIQSRES